ncbi:hypothetical protein RI367_006300 [Sorochytrium milnesiophthora]
MSLLQCTDLDLSLKVLLVGSGGVGKSSLIRRFTRAQFHPHYKKTVGVEYAERTVAVSAGAGGDVKLMLWDTAGQEEFDQITRQYYDGANAVVLVFSVTDRASMDAVKSWKRKVDQVVSARSGAVPPDVVLVMNKTDTWTAADTVGGGEDVVMEQEGRRVAQELGVDKVYAVSVKDNVGIDQVFVDLANSFAEKVEKAGGIENIVAAPMAATKRPSAADSKMNVSVDKLADSERGVAASRSTSAAPKSAKAPSSSSASGRSKSPIGKDKECTVMSLTDVRLSTYGGLFGGGGGGGKSSDTDSSDVDTYADIGPGASRHHRNALSTNGFDSEAAVASKTSGRRLSKDTADASSASLSGQPPQMPGQLRHSVSSNALRTYASNAAVGPSRLRSFFDSDYDLGDSQTHLPGSPSAVSLDATTPAAASADSKHQQHSAPVSRGASAHLTQLDTSRGRNISQEISSVLPWDNISRWIKCFCVVAFDLEAGQALEYMYPPVAFSEPEERTIRFSAFPDSNSDLIGDLLFSFRIRRHDISPMTPSLNTTTSPLACANLPKMSDEYLYAYTFFRQKPDPTIRRGFYQKSVVLISSLPFAGLFTRVVSIVGPAACDIGKPALEAACHNIGKWPAPTPGVHDLPLLGKVLQCFIPTSSQPELLERATFSSAQLDRANQLLSGQLYTSIYPNCIEIIDHLWTCWELILTNEPIVLFSSNPGSCSAAVLGLVNLIKPIPYSGDYRPYLTIQDPDFRYIVKSALAQLSLQKAQPKVILGVTNPFFHKTLESWPHIVCVERPRARSGRAGSGIGSLEPAEGMSTKWKRVVGRDKNLLKSITELSLKNPDNDFVIDNMIRRHFAELTSKFLQPLEVYFASLVPSQLPLIPRRLPIELKPFNQDAFLKSLADCTAPFPLKSRISRRSDWMDLYRAFLRSGNFATWLELRIDNATVTLHQRYMAGLLATDLAEWAKRHPESKIVELYSCIAQLMSMAVKFPVARAQVRQLERQTQDMLAALGSGGRTTAVPPIDFASALARCPPEPATPSSSSSSSSTSAKSAVNVLGLGLSDPFRV